MLHNKFFILFYVRLKRLGLNIFNVFDGLILRIWTNKKLSFRTYKLINHLIKKIQFNEIEIESIFRLKNENGGIFESYIKMERNFKLFPIV